LKCTSWLPEEEEEEKQNIDYTIHQSSSVGYFFVYNRIVSHWNSLPSHVGEAMSQY